MCAPHHAECAGRVLLAHGVCQQTENGPSHTACCDVSGCRLLHNMQRGHALNSTAGNNSGYSKPYYMDSMTPTHTSAGAHTGQPLNKEQNTPHMHIRHKALISAERGSAGLEHCISAAQTTRDKKLGRSHARMNAMHLPTEAAWKACSHRNKTKSQPSCPFLQRSLSAGACTAAAASLLRCALLSL